MESPQLTKQECTRLGIFSTALAVGTYCAVVGTAGVGIPVAMVGTILASVAGGIVTDEVSAISNRLGKDTVGKAIAAVIVAVADSKQFPKETAGLRKMAKLAEDKWENLVENLPGEFAPIQESQLTDFFANRPEDFSNLTALDIDLWVALLDDLRWKAGVILAQPVITYTAKCLYEIFPKALREVLKEDFQSDGKAFAGMVLDLFGMILSQISENHNLILQRLDEIKQQNPSAIPADFNLDEFEQRLELLSQKSQDEIAAELRSVSGQIDSGFREVLQQMGVVQTGITELLENSNIILDRLEDLSEQSQKQHEKLVELIEKNSPPEIVQAKYWQFLLHKKDESRPNWLEFLTEYDAAMIGVNKGSYFEPPLPLENPPTIPANESLFLRINLEYPNYQLLLFNRSKQGINLYCPSFGYAINPIIESPQTLLPQKDSWAEKTRQKFLFKQTGKEEFLAIVFEKHLNLHWLSPKREEALPELNAERIQELYEQLRQQDTWHIFYKSFQVV
jgi:hypothetical protein